jgi:pimeloyl-ACP methyl ester carboxylesterase
MRPSLLLAALALSGCGAAPRASLDGCAHGRPVGHGVVVGTGATTFVLTNESDEDLCAWLPFTRTLERHGYSALLYDYTDPATLPAQVAAAARAAGGRRIVLMGASVGARASIAAAAKAPPGVVAVVSLSAERTVRSDPTDLVRRARHVTIPTLLVSAREDPFAQDATRPLLHALAARRKRALIVGGADHGTALLTRRAVRDTILTFVARHM